MERAEHAYRKTAAGSGLGLLIALYDTLANDLRRAAEAERAQDLVKRCREVNHALLIVGHLEQWVDRGAGGQLASQLKAFYAKFRKSMIEAQVKRSPEMLEAQMHEVLKLREAWQALDLRRAPAGPEILPPAAKPKYAEQNATEGERRRWSWSA